MNINVNFCEIHVVLINHRLLILVKIVNNLIGVFFDRNFFEPVHNMCAPPLIIKLWHHTFTHLSLFSN
jgi:hypothetical protein